MIYQSEPTTVQYHLDRASARTEAEREEHWRYWWTKYGEPYQVAVIEAGGTPWTADPDERRRVWFRRYERPAFEMQSLAPERTAEHATAVAPMDATTHQDSPAESPAA